MPVTHPRFRHCPQLDAASENKPPLKKGASGDGVQRVQTVLRDLGYALPISTLPDGTMDGIYGSETRDVVYAFQLDHDLADDGEAGKNTIRELELALALPPTRPKVEDDLPYKVREPVRKLLQRDLEHPDFSHRPTDSLCWAAAFTTMLSWRDGVFHRPVDAIETLGDPFIEMFKFGRGMRPDLYQLLLARAKMWGTEHGTVPTAAGWLGLLKKHGLLWVGAASDSGPEAFRHSFIVHGMFVEPRFGIRFYMHEPSSPNPWLVGVEEFNRMIRNLVWFHYPQIRYYPHRGLG